MPSNRTRSWMIVSASGVSGQMAVCRTASSRRRVKTLNDTFASSIWRCAGEPGEPRDHGHCRSLYTSDPNGLWLEFTPDASGIEDTHADRRRTAHADLQAYRWTTRLAWSTPKG
jgi:hypothetical protein